MREDEIRRAQTDLDAARKLLGGKRGKNGPGDEACYAQAYQRLVRLGAQPQLKGKYR